MYNSLGRITYWFDHLLTHVPNHPFLIVLGLGLGLFGLICASSLIPGVFSLLASLHLYPTTSDYLTNLPPSIDLTILPPSVF